MLDLEIRETIFERLFCDIFLSYIHVVFLRHVRRWTLWTKLKTQMNSANRYTPKTQKSEHEQ